jgi:multidrug efflux pump subunit AcrA (membrane-fusion protein)
MRRGKVVVNGVLLAGASVLGVVAYRSVGTAASTGGTVTTSVTATVGNVLQTVSASGNVAAPVQTGASFSQAGTVKEIDVKVGDVVQAGDPIAKVDDSTQQEALAVAKDNLAQVQASIAATNGGPTSADQSAAAISEQQSTNGVTSAKASIASAEASAAQDAATAATNVTTARQNLATAQAQLASDTSTVYEDQSLYDQVSAASDPQRPAGESTNQTLLRYQHDQDICGAKGTPDDGVSCSDLSNLTRLLQAVSNATKAVTSSNNSVTQAQNALTSAQRNQSATATKDAQAVAQAQRGLDSASLTLWSTVQTNQSKQAPPTAQVLAQQAAQLSQAQNSVDAAQRNVDETVLKAPISGTIVTLNGTIGLSSSSTGSSGSGTGSSSSNAFATIVDLTQLQVKAGFAEADAAKLTVGQAATVTFDALPNVTATAKVTTIDSLATVTSNVVTYTVALTLDSAPRGVKPGMTSTASVVAAHSDGVVTLPTSAVPTRGTTATLTIRSKAGKETQTRVTIGLRGDQTVEISSGLAAGDVVVIRTAISGGGSSTRPGLGTGTGGVGGAGAVPAGFPGPGG